MQRLDRCEGSPSPDPRPAPIPTPSPDRPSPNDSVLDGPALKLIGLCPPTPVIKEEDEDDLKKLAGCNVDPTARPPAREDGPELHDVRNLRESVFGFKSIAVPAEVADIVAMPLLTTGETMALLPNFTSPANPLPVPGAYVVCEPSTLETKRGDPVREQGRESELDGVGMRLCGCVCMAETEATSGCVLLCSNGEWRCIAGDVNDGDVSLEDRVCSNWEGVGEGSTCARWR